MRRLTATFMILMLAGGLSMVSALAKDHGFQLHRDATLHGEKLQAGSYQLKLNEHNEAELYRRGKLVATSKVEVKPLTKGQTPEAVVLGTDGKLMEIRTKSQVVVFVGKMAGKQ